MIENFIERFAFMLGFTALTLCVGLLLLVAAREVYEVDARRRSLLDPLGHTYTKWEYVLMSDFAQNARTELKLLGEQFASTLKFLVWTVVGLYSLDFLFQFLFFCFTETGWFPNWLSNSVRWVFNIWRSLGQAEHLARYALGLVVIVSAPFFVGRAAAIVRHVIRAKDEPMSNKHPWWATQAE